jgi:hypothetical protein
MPENLKTLQLLQSLSPLPHLWLLEEASGKLILVSLTSSVPKRLDYKKPKGQDAKNAVRLEIPRRLKGCAEIDCVELDIRSAQLGSFSRQPLTLSFPENRSEFLV